MIPALALALLFTLTEVAGPQASSPPGALAFTVEVDVRPTPRWEQGDFDAVFAVRDSRNGSRIDSIELQMSRGQSRRSSKELPGRVGTLSVEMELEGSKAAVYTVEVRRDGAIITAHRARIQLER